MQQSIVQLSAIQLDHTLAKHKQDAFNVFWQAPWLVHVHLPCCTAGGFAVVVADAVAVAGDVADAAAVAGDVAAAAVAAVDVAVGS